MIPHRIFLDCGFATPAVSRITAQQENRMRNTRFISVVALLLLAFVVTAPACSSQSTNAIQSEDRPQISTASADNTKRLVFAADLSRKDPALSDDQVMHAELRKVEQRLDGFGVKGFSVTRERANLVVKLPEDTNVGQITGLIEQTGVLTFMELSTQSLDSSGNLHWTDGSGRAQSQAFASTSFDTTSLLTKEGRITWVPSTAAGSDGTTVALTGKYLKANARVEINQVKFYPMDSQGNRLDDQLDDQLEIAFEWTSEGAVLFEAITGRLYKAKKAPLGIFLDGELISAPRVQAVIKDKGVIQGVSFEEAKILAAQLNAGSLDVPLTLIES